MELDSDLLSKVSVSSLVDKKNVVEKEDPTKSDEPVP